MITVFTFQLTYPISHQDKIISTMIVVPMALWVIVTIKTTRSLHNTHNIYVAYVMAMDIMFALPITLLSGAMTIGYFTGVGDVVGCNVFMFMLYPGGIYHIAGKFRGRKFSRFISLKTSCELNFKDRLNYH